MEESWPDMIIQQEFFDQQYGRKVLLPHEPKYLLMNSGRLKVQVREFSGWQKRKKQLQPSMYVLLLQEMYAHTHNTHTHTHTSVESRFSCELRYD